MTTEPQNPKPADGAAAGSAPPRRGLAWARRLPGDSRIWLAAVALLAACFIGSCGFIAGAVVSHGFGESGYSRERGPGDGRYGEHRRNDDDRTPAPSSSVSPRPSPSSPAPTASPTA